MLNYNASNKNRYSFKFYTEINLIESHAFNYLYNKVELSVCLCVKPACFVPIKIFVVYEKIWEMIIKYE